MKKQIRTYSRDNALVSERRKQIVKACTRLFITKGYDHSNTREICEVVGMSKGTLYHYVGAKIDILYMVFQFALADQRKIIEKMRLLTKNMDSIDALKKSIEFYFINVDEMQDMYNFINHAIVNLPKEDRYIIYDSEKIMIEYFQKLIEKDVKNSKYSPDIGRLIAHNIVISANAWAHRRWYLRKFYTLEGYIYSETSQILAIISAYKTQKDPHSKVPHSKLWGITGRGATPPQFTDEAAFIPPAS